MGLGKRKSSDTHYICLFGFFSNDFSLFSFCAVLEDFTSLSLNSIFKLNHVRKLERRCLFDTSEM